MNNAKTETLQVQRTSKIIGEIEVPREASIAETRNTALAKFLSLFPEFLSYRLEGGIRRTIVVPGHSVNIITEEREDDSKGIQRGSYKETSL